MPLSMTGFGRSSVEGPLGTLVVEIQALNRKYLDLSIFLPKEFSRFESEVRSWVTESISRGQLSLRTYLLPLEKQPFATLPDAKTLKGLKKQWDKIATFLGMDTAQIDLKFLMEYLSLKEIPVFADAKDLKVLHKGVEKALSDLLQMKKREGEALSRDIAARLVTMEQGVDTIESYRPDATERMRQKLMDKMQQLVQMSPDFEERLFKEVALFAEKVDTSEEITRLRSHFAQFRQYLKIQQGAIGRKLDFLVQEMGREINTIGSKSSEAKISHLVVELKAKLEEIREQVQNVE